jgi:hypothetical protein
MTLVHPALNDAARLAIIATSIDEHVAAAGLAIKRGLDHAIAAGRLLLEARELVGHGNWIQWLEGNCRVGVRQAQTFMRLARNAHKVAAAAKYESDSYLTIAAATVLIGKPPPEREHGLPGQLDLGGPEWEVRAPAAPAPRPSVPVPEPTDHELLGHRIIDLEYALAVIRAAQGAKFRQRGRVAVAITNEWNGQMAHLAAAADRIEAALAYLREMSGRAV